MPEDRKEADEARERIAASDEILERAHRSPGYLEYRALDGLARMLTGVFGENRADLVSLLNQPNHELELAMELVQNVYRDDVRQRYHAELARRLHNYVASTMTLVDQVRRHLIGRSGELVDEFEARKAMVIATPEVPFMQGLRNFSLHRALPVSGSTVNFAAGDEFECVVGLSVPQLLEWDGWKRPARDYLEQQAESQLALLPVVERHGQVMTDVHTWLINELSRANSAALAAANELLVEAEAVRFGVSIDEARRRIDETTKRRRQPRPEPQRDG